MSETGESQTWQLGFGRIVTKDPRLNIGTGEMSTPSPSGRASKFCLYSITCQDLHFGRSFALIFTEISGEEDFSVIAFLQSMSGN